jgi:hypothetical protein
VDSRGASGARQHREVNCLAPPRPQALAGRRSQPERGYNEAGAGGVPTALQVPPQWSSVHAGKAAGSTQPLALLAPLVSLSVAPEGMYPGRHT